VTHWNEVARSAFISNPRGAHIQCLEDTVDISLCQQLPGGLPHKPASARLGVCSSVAAPPPPPLLRSFLFPVGLSQSPETPSVTESPSSRDGRQGWHAEFPAGRVAFLLLFGQRRWRWWVVSAVLRRRSQRRRPRHRPRVNLTWLTDGVRRFTQSPWPTAPPRGRHSPTPSDLLPLATVRPWRSLAPSGWPTGGTGGDPPSYLERRSAAFSPKSTSCRGGGEDLPRPDGGGPHRRLPRRRRCRRRACGSCARERR